MEPKTPRTELERRMDEYYANRSKVQVIRQNSRSKVLRRNLNMVAEALDRPCDDCGGKFPTWIMRLDDNWETARFAFKQGGLENLRRSIAAGVEQGVVCANCLAQREQERHPNPLPVQRP